MTAIIAQLGATVGGILITMAGQLVTERFIKTMVVHALGVVVRRTQTPEDDAILQAAKQAWGVE